MIGTSHVGVLETVEGLQSPCDMYLEEATIQRLVPVVTANSVAQRTAPYKTVLTHGFVVDGEGHKCQNHLATESPLKIINITVPIF